MSKSSGRRSCGIGCLVLPVVLIPLAGSYYTIVNRIPPAPQISVTLPNPNARDVYLRAEPLLPADLPKNYLAVERPSEPQLKSLVHKGSPALKILKQGLPLEYGAPPVTSFLTLRPELKVYRDLVTLQIAEARLEERRNNIASAAKGYLNVLRIGAQVSNGPALQDGMMSIPIQKAALRGLERLIPHMAGELAHKTSLEIETLEKQILDIDDTLKREALVNECASIEVMWIARSGSPQAKADMSLNSVVFGYNPAYLLTPKDRMIGAMRRYYEAFRAAATKPYWERGPFPEEPDDPLNTMLLTPLQASVFASDTAEACFQLVKVKLAARAYETSVGRLPQRLEDLVPRYIPSIQDPFSGKPLRLKHDPVSGRQVIYSVGPDKDDDGGRGIKEGLRPDAHGDLIRVPDR